jgi:hypothetical protein
LRLVPRDSKDDLVPLHPFPARLAAILAALLTALVLLGCGATRSEADARPVPATDPAGSRSRESTVTTTAAVERSPASATVVGPDDEVLADADLGGTDGPWRCASYANIGGEVPQTPTMGQPILAEPGQYVAFICFDEGGGLVHEEARYHDPADPFGSLDP